MTTKFKLKKESLPFFEEKYATCIYDYETWNGLKVSQNALEKAEPVHITYGIRQSDSVTNACGWSSENLSDRGSRFHFTINIPLHSHEDYEEFSKELNIRNLMDEIQQLINNKL